MLEKNGIVRQFPSLGSRIVYAYIASYPEFVAVGDDKALIEAQHQMHAFIYDALNIIYNQPELINIAQQSDEYFQNKAMSNGNPELIDKMTAIEYKLIDFFALLHKIGVVGSVNHESLTISKSACNIAKKTCQKLERLGLRVSSDNVSLSLTNEKYPQLFSGWKQYVDLESGNLIKRKFITNFMFGRHSNKVYRASQMFGRLIDEPDRLKELEDLFSHDGFTLSNDMLSITWSKQYPNKKKASFTVRYYWRNEDPLSFKLQIPNFRTIFDQYDKLSDTWKNFIYSRTKTCDGCNYCIQTDREHRSKLAVPLKNSNETLYKCPLYPDLTWYDLSFAESAIIKDLYRLSTDNV
jgi:hypothetical protein